MKISIGKLPPNFLEAMVFPRIGIKDHRVLVGPSVGEDAAIVDVGNGSVLVAHVDPITEAIERVGWLSVHIASNDVAVRGVKPEWFLSVILLPPTSTLDSLDLITKQIDDALREVSGTIIGGHTEVSPGLEKPVVIMTAMGIGSRDDIVLTRGAKPGDYVIVTKAVGLEGTAIIASDFKSKLLGLGVQQSTISEAISYFKEVSVLKEALALSKMKSVSSMHDPTEGGLLNGLIEVARASKCIIEVYEKNVPIREATKVICDTLSLDPLKLISSGSLIAMVKPNYIDKAMNVLRDLGIDFSVIGRVISGGGPKVLLHRADGMVEEFSDYVQDEISKLWVNSKGNINVLTL
ncbi:MAG: AIR synthase family protein [Candidatus Nezhaarchaeota archaeon]|nr:AIR synthase family protein [Candidatus Nezhaarchaeota archaeon]MCX8141826.1 AIR synthase family protein [Candidatus Nezhaarchaeota archaeon]MDW8050393.1 AIR synthase family protein [Nitrososphaerota archaeon]